MIEVLQHPRVERLLDALADELRARPGGPLEPETVVVETQGLARRLPLELADRLGSVVRLRTPFPARFLFEILIQPLLPSPDALAPWSSGALAWRLAALLREEELAAGPPAQLLEGDRDGRLRHGLARRLADLFDQYLVHRPGLLLEWEGRADNGLAGAGLGLPETPALAWQRALWRRLRREMPAPHRAELLAQALARLAAGEAPVGLPARLSLFALCGLPPDQLRAFDLLSRRLPVRLYLQSPSPEYWGDLPRRRRRQADEPLQAQLPLLAANGHERGRWIDQLLEADADFSSLPDDGGEADTLLARVQRSHRALAPLAAGAADHSLQLHSCHTLARQAEVLADRLLDLFQRLPGLSPDQVLVLCPDLEAARPALQAALEAQEEGRAIPWRLAAPPAGGLAAALAQVLELPGSRWESGRVLAPLACPALRRRQGLEAADLPLVQEWCREAGVRWGWDASSREALGLPATGEHGWRAGLDRLLLGYAMAGEGEVAGLLPLPAAGEAEPARVQAWLGWLRLLRQLEAEATAPRLPAQWAFWLRHALPLLFAPEAEEEGEFQALLAELWRLEEEAHDVREPVPLAVAREAFLPRLAALDAGERGHFAPDGRLIVAPMLAGRLLPARVVALLGLDDQLFPRPNPRDELDLCLARPLPGDRNPREQDRAQFLDALHAARDALLIFWNGRDARENARRPPSVVVSELLAALEPASGAQPLVVEHPLQCFSPACFTGPPEARSFHAGRARAAARLRLARRAPETLGLPGPAFLAPLPLPEPPAELRLEELARFFHNPARALLTRAGVALPRREEEPEDCEPFASDPLDRGLLRGAALAGIRAGQDLERIERGLRAAGQLPWGRAGRAELETAAAQVAPLAEEELRFRESGAAAVEVDLELAGLRLRGRLEAAGGRRLEVLARSSAGVALMGSWLRHLAWCCATGGGVTRVLCRDQSWELACPAQPARLLEVVLARWRQGQRAWLPWLPVISEQIAALADKGEGDELLERLAEHDWYERREHLFDEAWLQLALGEADPFTHPELAPRVLELALELGAPLRGATT